jgi:hypothetical protein
MDLYQVNTALDSLSDDLNKDTNPYIPDVSSWLINKGELLFFLKPSGYLDVTISTDKGD